MNLQFKLWLRLASTDKVAFTKLLLVSGLSPEFLSAFDEPTLNGIIENFIASTDWRPIEQTIRVDLSMDVREYAARIKTPTLLVTGKHDQIVPPTYSENLVADAKTLELNSGRVGDHSEKTGHLNKSLPDRKEQNYGAHIHHWIC
jgi:3-oxoadipate enol-lactonase